LYSFSMSVMMAELPGYRAASLCDDSASTGKKIHYI
jgi:hypothetical protein